MAIYSKSSVQKFDDWLLCFRKKTNALLNLINEQDDIDKIYLYTKDLNKPNYEVLIKKRENAGIKHFNDSNAFIESSNTMDDVYRKYWWL